MRRRSEKNAKAYVSRIAIFNARSVRSSLCHVSWASLFCLRYTSLYSIYFRSSCVIHLTNISSKPLPLDLFQPFFGIHSNMSDDDEYYEFEDDYMYEDLGPDMVVS